MSTSESLGGDPNYLDADGHHIPPDPLLSSDTFIEVNNDPSGATLNGPQRTQNGVSGHGPLNQFEASEPELPASPVAYNSTGAEGLRTSAADGAESTPSYRKGAVDSSPEAERPKWLPEGWKVVCKVRASGATAGSVDRYYIEPVSGRRFRSKVEVDYFLQTGSKRKKKHPPDADVNSSENPGGCKQKKSAPRKLNFDFSTVPEKVCWVLTDASMDQWTPYIGDEVVSKSVRKEWNDAFEFCCS